MKKIPKIQKNYIKIITLGIMSIVVLSICKMFTLLQVYRYILVLSRI